MFVSLSFGIVLPPPNTPLSMPCRLRFNFAFTGRRSLDLRVTQASQATMGDVLRLMYKHAKCIPANAGVELIGSKTGDSLSKVPHRFLWRRFRTS